MIDTKLFDERGFYPAFKKDLLHASHEVVIESPFITKSRVDQLQEILFKLVSSGVRIYVITRDP